MPRPRKNLQQVGVAVGTRGRLFWYVLQSTGTTGNWVEIPEKFDSLDKASKLIRERRAEAPDALFEVFWGQKYVLEPTLIPEQEVPHLAVKRGIAAGVGTTTPMRRRARMRRGTTAAIGGGAAHS
jgi:hypothetical protein